jgi:cytochrome c-type biogenesis protein CcmH
MRRFLLIFLLCTTPALAITVDDKLTDSAMEARAQQLFHELRCMVCAGESIADSPAEVARDMRIYVRQQISEGKSDKEILDTLASQYGEGVLMMPPLENHALLWAMPLLLLAAGGVMARKYLFRSAA